VNPPPNLLPTEPLSQVVFIHDYFQLVFQDSSFSIFNTTVIRFNGAFIQQGHQGFCDHLIGLIGQSVLGVAASDDSLLSLTFQDGTELSVTPIGQGPEAWQFNTTGSPSVIAQNA
jgi:hypothetical protein